MKTFSNEYKTTPGTAVQEKWDKFETKLMTVIDEHIPTKLSSNRRNLPWFERSHRRLCRKKQRLYSKAKKSGKQNDWDNYRN